MNVQIGKDRNEFCLHKLTNRNVKVYGVFGFMAYQPFKVI